MSNVCFCHVLKMNAIISLVERLICLKNAADVLYLFTSSTAPLLAAPDVTREGISHVEK